MITFTDSDTRRETYILGGWNLADDDLPRPRGLLGPSWAKHGGSSKRPEDL